MLGEGDEHKLFIKINCSICLGGRREGVFMNCPYCDLDSKTFIEASFDTIKTNLKENLSKKETNELINYLGKNK